MFLHSYHYFNILISQNLSTFPFLKAVCNFSFPKVPFGFTVRGQNLTQTKSYVLNNISAFNQNISAWNVSNVANMSYMFYNAIAFNNANVFFNANASFYAFAF